MIDDVSLIIRRRIDLLLRLRFLGDGEFSYTRSFAKLDAISHKKARIGGFLLECIA